MSGSPFAFDIAVEDPAWGEIYGEGLVERLQAVAEELAKALPGQGGTATLILTSDEHVRTLNRTFRAKDRPTNVLSFPVEGAALEGAQSLPAEASRADGQAVLATPFLGDVFLALSTIQQEAAAQNKAVEAHTVHLALHGFLHLLGFTHQEPPEVETSDTAAMEGLEIRILAALGYENPYIDC